MRTAASSRERRWTFCSHFTIQGISVHYHCPHQGCRLQGTPGLVSVLPFSLSQESGVAGLCRGSACLQVWDEMTEEHGGQHNGSIQLLSDMGRERLALIGLQQGHRESAASDAEVPHALARPAKLLLTSKGLPHMHRMHGSCKASMPPDVEKVGAACTLEASRQVFDRTNVRTLVSVSRLKRSTFCRHAKTRWTFSSQQFHSWKS